MKGGHELFAMRRAGYKTEYVWVSDLPFCLMDGVTVCVAEDTPEIEDFRFLVGVTALVNGQDPKRVARITKACKAHAKRVIASVVKRANEFDWEVVSVTDTEGVLTWQI